MNDAMQWWYLHIYLSLHPWISSHFDYKKIIVTKNIRFDWSNRHMMSGFDNDLIDHNYQQVSRTLSRNTQTGKNM